MESNIIDYINSLCTDNLKINCKKTEIQVSKKGRVYTFNIDINKDGSIKIYNSTDIVEDNHLVNIINKKKYDDINLINDLFEDISEIIENLYNHCVVCQNKLEVQSTTFIPCSENACLYKFEEYIIGNPLIGKILEDPDISLFLINSAFDAMTCDRKMDIFEPFPHHFLIDKNTNLERGTISKLTGKNYDNLKDFTQLNKIVQKLNESKLDELFKKILTKTYKSDKEIVDEIGKNSYILLRFIIMSCKVQIELNDDMLGIKSNKFKLYKIIHPQEKEEEFNKLQNGVKTNYLFHGSKWHNWFSILRNGLKNCSQTKLMTAGAAHGNGIYLSNDINLSYSYGVGGSKDNSCKSVIGVFEVINIPKYNKSGTIYVVDDEKVLIQRYLLILSSGSNTDLVEINEIFNKKIYVEKAKVNISYNKKSITKIVREYKTLLKIPQKQSQFRVVVDPNFPFEWNIFLNQFDEKYLIGQDMKKYNVKEIELEIKFPPNYPFSPPFIRVVRPRFMHLTAHITLMGSFCHELLTEKGWSPSCTIESLLTILISEMLEGEARLDPSKLNIPYNEAEARESFTRIAKAHGWL